MRCYLMKGGHIATVKELPPDLLDEEAIEQCGLLFETSLAQFDDFEVWYHMRKIYRNSDNQNCDNQGRSKSGTSRQFRRFAALVRELATTFRASSWGSWTAPE